MLTDSEINQMAESEKHLFVKGLVEVMEAKYYSNVDEADAILKYIAGAKALRDKMKVPVIKVECFDEGVDDIGFPVPYTWLASWSLFPGMVVSADTKEQAIDELMTSIRVKLLYDLETSDNV